MAEFSLDTRKLTEALKKSSTAATLGAAAALGEIKDDWVRESRDIAPIDPGPGGNLRRQIKGDVINPGASGTVEIHANATQDTGGKRFNYAYYIHEHDAGGGTLRTPGTVKKFLDESAESRKGEWQQWLEEEVAKELGKAGWRG